MYKTHFGYIHSPVPSYNLYWTLLTPIILSLMVVWSSIRSKIASLWEDIMESTLFPCWIFLHDLCRSCAQNHSFCEFMYAIGMSRPEDSISQCFTSSSRSYALLTLDSTIFPKPPGAWYNCACTLAHFQHFVHI